jgi:NAD(P)H-dependent FMN reductase
MKIALISSSLSPHSHSRAMLAEAEQYFTAKGVETDLIDLRNLELEWCDGRPLENYNSSLQDAFQRIQAADGAVLASPVYCYSISGVLKNFIDICHAAFTEKDFAVIIAGGGDYSFMVTEQLKSILVLESRAFPLPRAVFANEKQFKNHQLNDAGVKKRLQQLAEDLAQKIGESQI